MKMFGFIYEACKIIFKNNQRHKVENIEANFKNDNNKVILAEDLLHEFFNHKSDANLYLLAEQQEEMEESFKWYIFGLHADNFKIY